MKRHAAGARGIEARAGMSLIELLLAIMLLSIITAGAAMILDVCLRAQAYSQQKEITYSQGMIAMNRMTTRLRSCSHVMVPGKLDETRNLLALSGSINDDNDFFFGDPLFPRIDEDTTADNTFDDVSGVHGVDDDGDSSTDEAHWNDDDEDGVNEDDPINGEDDDEDGEIDEDWPDDMNNDGAPGIDGMDDDGDGVVDEGHFKDDDEDGVRDEDPLNALVYKYDSGSKTLLEVWPQHGDPVIAEISNVIATNVTAFSATRVEFELLFLTLTLTDDSGESVTFAEYVCPRNVRQLTGKRVR